MAIVIGALRRPLERDESHNPVGFPIFSNQKLFFSVEKGKPHLMGTSMLYTF